ncbi:thioesterase family protein [Nocardia bovistercoris]|uniref:Thioesterase family protein n=1 Tax=Nocardia bovistercoris TaxID=2785916 RepID=A0A931IE16_9NOCA|nr:thioesterase family protein [Nocardia bovistercoris]MBH0779739.1 thioesterase family protein [Nocardia bovistercoris]
MGDAYYELIDTSAEGEVFSSADLTRGTWGDMQHGGPPSALLVRALERCEPRADARLSRIVVELLGPVPVGPVRVVSKKERRGTRIEYLSAVMSSADDMRPVARAHAWRMERSDTVEIQRNFGEPLTPLENVADRNDLSHFTDGYVGTLDWRWIVEPGSTPGAGESWIRSAVDLVQGEAPSPLERLFVVADNANGVGAKADIRKWTFLNTDLTVHVHRMPEGDWIGIRADAAYGPDGIGATIGTLFDQHGPVAGIQQSVLLRRRS